MKRNNIIVFFVQIFFCFSCNPTKDISKKTLLKEYALCKCLNYAYNDSSSKNDISAGVYREIAGYGFETYDMIDSLAQKVADSIKPSQIFDHNGKKAIEMNCIAFYRSRQLDSFVKVIIKLK